MQEELMDEIEPPSPDRIEEILDELDEALRALRRREATAEEE